MQQNKRILTKKTYFNPPTNGTDTKSLEKTYKQTKYNMLHAGRYWDDKELRYLRIVIVTTSVSLYTTNRTDTENISPLSKKNLDQNAMFLLTSRQALPLNTPKNQSEQQIPNKFIANLLP